MTWVEPSQTPYKCALPCALPDRKEAGDLSDLKEAFSKASVLLPRRYLHRERQDAGTIASQRTQGDVRPRGKHLTAIVVCLHDFVLHMHN